MKRYVSVLGLALLISLFFVMPVAAYGGVTGQTIDSGTQENWTHGGDVWIVNSTQGNILATGSLDANGAFAINYGDDGLGGAPGDYTINTTRASGDQIEVVVNFACDYSGACTGGTEGTPGDASVVYSESGIPITKNVGYISTGTGPNAVTFTGFAASANVWLPVSIVVGVSMLALGALVVVRRRR